ncbi:coiled-coil domain-containing protein 159 [Aotus nancymaae]|uniref:coiled-coil domain-containing protein 159 n=1 Tax=Aotus nancymaae TaxID=37293 RepID=UPI0030FE64B3
MRRPDSENRGAGAKRAEFGTSLQRPRVDSDPSSTVSPGGFPPTKNSSRLPAEPETNRIEALTPRLFLGQGSRVYSSLVQDPTAGDLGMPCFWGRSEECRLDASGGLGASTTRGSPFPNPDLKKECRNNQDVLKRHHNKPLETSSSKVKAKTIVMIPDSQKLLRCELESLKSQLQAQTKAFEFLNHSVTVLEKESCLQQIKIQQLEEVLSPTGRQGEKEGHKSGPSLEQVQQELYGALAQGLQGLEKTLHNSEEVQHARTIHCLQLLAQEIHDSKKFLWEELELVWEEATCIYQKLQAQEDEISENLVNIQKMQKTQVKCRKILTKMKQQGYETSAWPETEEIPQGADGCWKDDLQKELSDIWSAVHVLQNSINGLIMSSGARPKASRGHKGHRHLSRPLPSCDSDSDSDQDLSQPPFNLSARVVVPSHTVEQPGLLSLKTPPERK